MKKREKILITISLIALILFALILLDIITNGPLTLLDIKINHLIPLIQISSLITLSKIIGIVLDPEPMIIFGILLSGVLWLVYSKKESYFLFLSMLFSGALVLAIKETVRIARPENSLVENTLLSFPSGHTAISIVLLGILCYWMFKSNKSRKAKSITLTAAILISLIIGLSRLYLNAHWFSDVLAGLCLGTFILTTGFILKEKFLNKNY